VESRCFATALALSRAAANEASPNLLQSMTELAASPHGAGQMNYRENSIRSTIDTVDNLTNSVVDQQSEQPT
jgi:hypothetical protein